MRREPGRRRSSPPAALVQALAEHGIGAEAHRAVASTVDLLRRLTRQTDREHASLVEADAGQQVGKVVVGLRTEIDLAPLIRLMSPSHRYVSLHSHTTDGPFSIEDAALLFVRPEVHLLMVVGAGGSTYLLSRSRSPVRHRFDQLLRAFRAAEAAREREKRLAVIEGRLSARAARAEQVHAIWSAIAGEYDLRYTAVRTDRTV